MARRGRRRRVGRGGVWTVGGEGGFVVYPVQKDGLGEEGGGRDVPQCPDKHVHKITQGPILDH